MNKKNCAIIYASLSSAESVTPKKTRPAFLRDTYLRNNIKIAKQEEICRDYCIKNNIEVLGVYHDKNNSTIDTKQKGLRGAMSYCKNHKGEIDSVIVTSIDRFSPSAKSYIKIKDSFLDYRIRIISVTGGNSDEERFNEGQMLPLS